MGTKNNPSEFDCYATALPDEPMFVLLARDVHAPELLEQWAHRRLLRSQYYYPNHSRERAVETLQALEALQCADAMRAWRAANDGKWRKPPECEHVWLDQPMNGGRVCVKCGAKPDHEHHEHSWVPHMLFGADKPNNYVCAICGVVKEPHSG
jgi:hypothetical protein